MNEPSEKDFLVYRGNVKPRVLRFAWTVFFIFSVYYIAKFAVPNLVEWMK